MQNKTGQDRQRRRPTDGRGEGAGESENRKEEKWIGVNANPTIPLGFEVDRAAKSTTVEWSQVEQYFEVLGVFLTPTINRYSSYSTAIGNTRQN